MLYKYIKRPIRYPESRRKRLPKHLTSLFLSLSCIGTGLGLIAYTLFPYVQNNNTNSTPPSKVLLSPSVNSEYVNNIQTEYNSNANRNISKTNQVLNINPKTHTEYSAIQGEMKFSIPKLGITDLPVQINVDSFNEKAYLPLLENKLAHFLGTSMPGKPGNTFIYGHSANEILAKYYPNNPKYAFSFLGNLDIGDEMLVTYDGKEYVYLMNQSKVVSSEDISPIYSTSEEQHLTLMTCWPPGIGTERLIIVGNLLEEKEV